MNPPDELMVGEFLPSFRALVSRSLRKDGMSQARIASLLGVTQASVSNYLSEAEPKPYEVLSGFSLDRSEATKAAARIASDLRRGASEGTRSVVSLWTELLGRGDVCPRHRLANPSLSDCTVCVDLLGMLAKPAEGTVADVAEAVRMLESSDSFASVMPEVSVNVAAIARDSDDPKDVVAVPGKLVNVRGRAKARQAPEAGASRHLAKVLLLARKSAPDVRGCINMKYDAKVSAALRALGLRELRISPYEPSGTEDPTLQAMKAALAGKAKPFDAIVDPGSRGVEANVYIFGKSAREVADLALRVSSRYLGS